ncbi:MAG: hypothetical protein AB7I48_04295 [Planctomycetaceae bacterium]
MDSRQNLNLREQLDAVRPDSDDLHDAGLKQAAAAVESSGAWRNLFEHQQLIDRRMADAMQDVEPPPKARQRLLDALAAARTTTLNTVPDDPLTEPEAELASTPAERRTRRKWTRLAIAAAGVAACLGLAIFLWNSEPAQFTLDDVRRAIPLAADGQIDLSGLSAFDESFTLEQPAGRWDRVEFDNPRGIDWSRDGRHDAAILPFVTNGRQPVRGYLLILPAAALADPPTRTFLSAADVNYTPLENTAAANATGDLVYLCFTDPGKLDDLQRLLYPQSA